jgi:DisA bacterial checkpoint controller nucleotide-binding
MNEARLRRLSEELAETGFDIEESADCSDLVLVELDYALRPHIHERRVPSVGAIIEPTTTPDEWERGTQLEIRRRPVEAMPLTGARLFADGLSSWLIRRHSGDDEWAVFDRPAGSERDMVVIAESFGATLVQRHPSGVVRIVGKFGVLRWDGLYWHHEPPIRAWIESLAAASSAHGHPDVIELLLEFAVHDLGAQGIGALLVYRPDGEPDPTYELRLPPPPPLDITRPFDLAPLRHALTQVDGAAVLDGGGILRQLGVRLIPSTVAETVVAGYRGMRHTSGRRYSFDDPLATVVVVSEDGPVTVLRAGDLVGTSPAPRP